MGIYEYLSSFWQDQSKIERAGLIAASIELGLYKNEQSKLVDLSTKLSERFIQEFDEARSSLIQTSDLQEKIAKCFAEYETMTQKEVELIEKEIGTLASSIPSYAKRVEIVKMRTLLTCNRIEKIREALAGAQRVKQRRYELLLAAEKVLNRLLKDG
jgi:hypothetical protein